MTKCASVAQCVVRNTVITFAKEAMLSPMSVCLSVCVSANRIT